MTTNTKNILNALWYLVVFLIVQLVSSLVVRFIVQPRPDDNDTLALVTIISSIVYAVLTLGLFYSLKWTPASRSYLRSQPWVALAWTVTFALGTILPAEWFEETLHLELPPQFEQIFAAVMSKPWGYLVVDILAPIAEEVVFRGAIQRMLQKVFTGRRSWIAIVATALLFALVHMNKAQGVHAFIIGIIIGWLYYRTDSIIPGLAVHFVNNSMAYALYNFFPQFRDGKLIDFFHGSTTSMALGILFSLCILVPSLYQLNRTLRKASVNRPTFP